MTDILIDMPWAESDENGGPLLESLPHVQFLPVPHPKKRLRKQQRRVLADLSHEIPVVTAGDAPLMAEVMIRTIPIWKRLMDISGAAIGLMLLAPIMIVVAIAIKLTSKGPIIFRQTRAGLGGDSFTMYKFRTMVQDAEKHKRELAALNEQDGPVFKISNDPRFTPIGRFLRRTSLDELPQLWNVIIGNMSLVGPRPLVCEEADACASWHRRRLEVTPGITCVWQVRGRSDVSFEEWMLMDLTYIYARSFCVDVLILMQTIPAVLFRRGAR